MLVHDELQNQNGLCFKYSWLPPTVLTSGGTDLSQETSPLAVRNLYMLKCSFPFHVGLGMGFRWMGKWHGLGFSGDFA